ncbi:MAG: class I SAM-dependent methyltransferase [Candidatus Buchananbacteria bacterium]|jgi:ubiquinone/menaquinone biosynthesis C-methylase UbiE
MEFKEQESKYWSDFYSKQIMAWQSDRDLPYHDDFKDYLMKLPKGSRILELACGIRCDGIELAQADFKVFETDIAPEAVNKAKRIYEKLGISGNGEFLICDAEKMPFADEYFDGVFISASFHHLPDPNAAIIEMSRVAKRGGLVILGLEPSSWPYFTVFRLLEPMKKMIRGGSDLKFHSIADDTTQGFTKKQLRKICESAGLEVIRVYREKYFGEYYDSGLRLFNKLLKLSLKPDRNVQKILCVIDRVISYVPIINLTNWHWSIICRKP